MRACSRLEGSCPAPRRSCSKATFAACLHMGEALRILILGGNGFIGPRFVREPSRVDVESPCFHEVGTTICRWMLSDSTATLTGTCSPSPIKSGMRCLTSQRMFRAGLQRSVPRCAIASGTTSTYPRWLPTAFLVPRMSRASRVYIRGDVDPYSLSVPGPHYPMLKALCERGAERQFPGMNSIIRAGDNCRSW